MKLNYTDLYPFKPIPSISVLDSYWQNGTWKFGSLEITPDTAYAPSAIEITLSGLGALTLVNALADSLLSLKLFGGTELLPETYIDSVTAEGKCEQRNLPEGYTELNYIETDGNEYIDINVSGNVTFLGTAQSTTDEPATSQVLFANGGAQAGRWFGVQSPGAGTGFAKKWGLGATATASTSIDGTTKVDFEITFSDVDGQYGTVNNETLTRTTSIPTQTDWIILAGNDIGQYGFIGKIWKLQAVQNNVLVRDLIPCKNSSNVVGMYDTVNGVFYQNAGTGTFTAGSDVVPSPDTPMDIVCNNGVIKYSKNMCDVKASNVVVGKYISAQGVLSDSDNNFTYIQYIPVKPNTTYTLSFSSPVYFASISEYNTAEDSGFIKRNTYYSVNTGNPPYDLVQCTVTTSSTTNYIRWDSNMYKSTAITIDDVLAVNYMFEIGSTPTAYVPYVEGGIYTDGTTETVTDSNGLTATCEMLLSAGNYKDTQKILSGAVSKNVGITILKGTENWSKSSTYTGSFYTSNYVPDNGTKVANNPNILTTHGFAVPDLSAYSSAGVGAFYWYSSTTVNYKYDNGTATVDQFKQWLADQYANGTPVIVVYPTSSATSETVDGQVLNKSPLTYAGSVSGLTGTVVTSSHTTPTPTQPLQLNCNNGVVKVSKNLLNSTDNLTTGLLYYNNGTINSSNTNYKTSDYKWIKAGTYTISCVSSFTETTNISLYIASYDTSKTFTGMLLQDNSNRKGYSSFNFTATSDCYIRVSWRITDSELQIEQGSTATTYHPYGTTYVDGTTEKVEVTGKNLYNSATRTTGYYISASGVPTENSGSYYSALIPVIPNTNYVYSGVAAGGNKRLHAYDSNGDWIEQINYASTTSGQSFTVTGTTPNNCKYVRLSGAIADTNVQLELGSTATTYEPYYNGGTATAEMLLKVGTYQDVQSVLDGAVTRNIGIKVFDGTENWQNISGYFNLSKTYLGSDSTVMPSNSTNIICSHFETKTGTFTNGIGIGGSYVNFKYDSIATTLTAWKQWLQDQYNAGTPVIVIYPLATATTEVVTAQPLTIQSGTNIVEITQSSMDNLELEVMYKAGVEVTITEVQNAQLDNSVEVTIG